MRRGDVAHWLAEFWSEFRREKSGLAGLGILLCSILLILAEPLLLPYPEANRRWRDITYWQDNSPSAPPAWTNAFRSRKAPVTSVIREHTSAEEELEGGVKRLRFETAYDYRADTPPGDLVFRVQCSGDIPVSISVERPDGEVIELAQRYEEGLVAQDLRISVDNDGREAAFAFLKRFEGEAALAQLNSGSTRATDVIFAVAREGMLKEFAPLKGRYRLVADVMLLDPVSFKADRPVWQVTGSVSGLLGTDDMKRDILCGVLAGLKWALFIGLFTSIVSVLIGVMYGIVSAYFGGAVDSVMQFIYQVFNGIPLLPVLIVLSAVFKPNIWFLIFVMVIFFWTGPVMTVRSMALQIKEETYIEAARALGAGHRRIIVRHMAPLLVPYSFASMALSVPSAIVYESSVSLLGLGDATIVTWGQILHDAMQGGAILNGLWWWIIPPGLCIALMGMTFAFLGFAMDKILHPKLRTR